MSTIGNCCWAATAAAQSPTAIVIAVNVFRIVLSWPSVAVLDRAVTVILEAVHAALRILLNGRALSGIAVVVGVLLALAVATAVVRRIAGVVDAALTGRRTFMPRVAWRRQFPRLRIQQRAVSARFLERRKS